MYSVVCFKGIDPKVIGKLMASMDPDFIIFKSILSYTTLSSLSLMDDLLKKFLIKKMFPDAFENSIRFFLDEFLKRNRQFYQLRM